MGGKGRDETVVAVAMVILDLQFIINIIIIIIIFFVVTCAGRKVRITFTTSFIWSQMSCFLKFICNRIVPLGLMPDCTDANI